VLRDRIHLPTLLEVGLVDVEVWLRMYAPRFTEIENQVLCFRV
jgi:hypothetical protein